MELDGFIVVKGVFFGEEGCSQSGLAVVIEFFIGESGENGGLANSCVANCDEFDLADAAGFFLS